MISVAFESTPRSSQPARVLTRTPSRSAFREEDCEFRLAIQRRLEMWRTLVTFSACHVGKLLNSQMTHDDMRTKPPMPRRTTLVSALCWAILLSSASAEDWPQWQGPDRNAISKETGLLKEWPKDGPPLAWKIKGLGGGYSAPSIAAGRIFGMSNRGEDEVVWALSEKDGKELWVTRLGPAFKQQAPQGKEGPGCTPTVDGERLYVEGLGGDVACLQVKDGKILWQRSLTTRFWRARPRCGVTANRRWLMAIRSSAPPAARTRCWWPSTS